MSGDGSAAGKETATPNMADYRADTVDADRAAHAIYSSHNLLPTTNRRLLESRPIDNIGNAIGHRPRYVESA